MKVDQFFVGLPVIINHTDCPMCRMVAVCESWDGKRLTARYISERTNMEKCWSERIENVTPIEHFGVSLDFFTEDDKSCFRTKQYLDSSAKYEDGKPRSWQDREGNITMAKYSTLKFLQKLVKQGKIKIIGMN